MIIDPKVAIQYFDSHQVSVSQKVRQIDPVQRRSEEPSTGEIVKIFVNSVRNNFVRVSKYLRRNSIKVSTPKINPKGNPQISTEI